MIGSEYLRFDIRYDYTSNLYPYVYVADGCDGISIINFED